MGDGISGNFGNSPSLGFGNFNGNTLGGGTGGQYAENGGAYAGMGWGSDDPSANLTAAFGNRGLLGASSGAIGSLGNFAGAPSGFGTFAAPAGAGAQTDATAAPDAGAASPYGNLSAVNFGGFGLNGLRTAAQAIQAAPTAENIQAQMFGGGLGFGINGPTQNGSQITAPTTIGSTGVLSTPTVAGFDNFGLGTGGVMTKSLGVLGDTDSLPAGFAVPEVGLQASPSIGGYTPYGWTNVGAAKDMVTSPADYFGDKYAALQGFKPSSNFAAGLFGDANVATGMTTPATAGDFQVNMIGAPTLGGEEDPTNATGMFGLTGPQRDAMLSALGIKTGPGTVDTMNALNGTMADQVGYSLNQIATNPQYAGVRAAALNPGLSPTEQANTFATGYQGVDPNNQVAAADRASEAGVFGGMFGAAQAYAAANPGIGNIGGPTAGPSPGLAGGAQPADQGYTAPSNPAWGAASDPSLAAALAADYAPRDTSFDSITDNQAKHDAAAAAFAGLPSMVGADTADRFGYTPYTSTNPSDVYSAGSYDTPTITPGMTFTNGDFASTEAPPLTVRAAPADAPAPDETTPQKVVRSTIDYGLPVVAPLIGIPNTISHLLGGPTLGGLISQSKPGTMEPLGGDESHLDTNRGSSNPYYEMYGGRSGSTTNTKSTAGTTTYDPAVDAAAAYQAALLHQTRGPAAKTANAVPLIAPRSAVTRQNYNPMADPAVIDALRHSGYRIS